MELLRTIKVHWQIAIGPTMLAIEPRMVRKFQVHSPIFVEHMSF